MRERHGSARPGSCLVSTPEDNVIQTSDGLHLIDFETACRGAIEWDLASLPPEAARWFGRIDDELLATLWILNSIRVATW